MELINENDDAGVLHQLLHDRLEALFKLTAILGPRHDEGDIQRQDALVRQKMGHVPAHDPLRKTLHDGGLPHPRFADQYRVVLRATTQHLLHPLELARSTHQWIQQVLYARVGQITAEL